MLGNYEPRAAVNDIRINDQWALLATLPLVNTGDYPGGVAESSPPTVVEARENLYKYYMKTTL